jgi:sterol desaturase/sphingolipid hydroxylase (fatty acid hydroxylase superfamily)
MSWATFVWPLVSLAAVAVMFIPLERAFPARRQQKVWRRETRLDLMFFFGQQLVWSVVALAILMVVRRVCDEHLAVLRGGFGNWPIVVQAVLVVVAGDVLVYFWHRACHSSPLLWRFHAVHHSTEELDWLAAHREHPLDGITTQLAQNLPAFLLGFPLGAIAAFAVFRGAWAIFVHSNTRLPLGPLRMLLGAPELHHWHHARVDQTKHNFANLAPWLDWLFGTYHRPPEPEQYPLGLDGEPPRGYFAWLFRPFLSKR